MDAIDPAATAWLLASTALVLLMTPGLAIFYGGMVRTTGVLNMIMMSFISIPLVTVAWLLVGYTLAFSEDGGGGLIGNLAHIGMLGIDPSTVHGTVPELLFATFQLGFAIITAALVSGAIADRAKFAAWMVFVPSGRSRCMPWWRTGCGRPAAGCSSWARSTTRADWSSRSSPASSALALALVLGPRIGFKKDAMRPHNLPFVLLGVGPAVVRLVRVQRRFGAGRQRHWRRRSSSTRWSPAASACWAGSRSSRSATAGRRRSAPPRVWSPAWSRSPRPAAR